MHIHLGSRCKALFIGAQANQVIGWPLPSDRMVPLEVFQQPNEQQFVSRPKRRVSHPVIWDDRCTVHHGAGGPRIWNRREGSNPMRAQQLARY